MEFIRLSAHSAFRLDQPIEYMKRDWRLGLGANPELPPTKRGRKVIKDKVQTSRASCAMGVQVSMTLVRDKTYL